MKAVFIFGCSVLLLSTISWTQSMKIVDSQSLPGGKSILLAYTSSKEVANSQLELLFVDHNTKDTLVRTFENIEHAPASYPNTIFFINDSIGFFTENGGCYASYNWLFRTTDKGVTWQHIESGSRIEGNFYCNLNNQTFYMFNEKQGFILWRMNEAVLEYSITNDGGINWKNCTQNLKKLDIPSSIEHVSYSSDGQITITCSEIVVNELDRQKVMILQSNNFGKSFGVMK